MDVSMGAKTSTATVTRPNDVIAYAAGDVIGESPAVNLMFSNVSEKAGGSIVITNLKIEFSASAIPSGMSGFRLHLYSAAPTAILDNSAFNLIAADRTKYLGYIPVANPVDLGDTLIAQENYVGLKMKLLDGSKTLYGVLETLGAYTPTAQCAKKITLEIIDG